MKVIKTLCKMPRTFICKDNMKDKCVNSMLKEQLEAGSSSSSAMVSRNHLGEETNGATDIKIMDEGLEEIKETKQRPTLFKKRKFNRVEFDSMGIDEEYKSAQYKEDQVTSENGKEEKVTSIESTSSQRNSHESPPPKSKRKQKPTKKNNKRNKNDKDKRPKHPMNAYNFFFQEERKKIVSGESEIAFEEIGKIIGKRWKQVPEEDLKRYTRLAADDLERYRTEMQEYRTSNIFEQGEAEEASNDEVVDRTSHSTSEIDINQEIMNEIFKSSLVGLGQAREILQRQQQPTIASTDLFANNLIRPELLLNGAALLPNMLSGIASLQQFVNPSLLNTFPQRSADNNRGQQIVFPVMNHPSIPINTGSQVQNILQLVSPSPQSNANNNLALINALNHQQALHALQLQQIQNQQHNININNPIGSLLDHQHQPSSSLQENELLEAVRNILSRNDNNGRT